MRSNTAATVSGDRMVPTSVANKPLFRSVGNTTAAEQGRECSTCAAANQAGGWHMAAKSGDAQSIYCKALLQTHDAAAHHATG